MHLQVEGGLKQGLGSLVEGPVSYKGSFKVSFFPSRSRTQIVRQSITREQVDVKHGYGEEEGPDFSYKGHFLLGKRC